MKTKSKIILLLAALPALGALGFVVQKFASTSPARPGGRRVVCYQDSMHPWIKSGQPGKCTICAMDLTPIYEGTPGFEVSEDLIVLSSNHITVLNVQTEPVQRQPLRRTLRVAGTLEASETSKRVIAAGKAGRVERLAVPYGGFDVAQGQCLAEFFIPELLAEARRYAMLARSDPRAGQARGGDLSNPLLSTLQNLRLFGLSEAQIEHLARSGDARGSFELLSPLTGTVIERNVSEGQYVSEGARLFTIVDLSVLWFRFDAYEQDLPWLRVGQTVEFQVAAAPGRVFSGPIAFIEPVVNEATRTAKVRVDVTNPVVELDGVSQRLLCHQQYAEGRVRGEAPARLLIPASAVLLPGGRPYAYVHKGEGVYELRQLELGRRGDQHWEVVTGLEAGENVVTAGNVLIDAQAQFTRGSGGAMASAKRSRSEPALATAPLPDASGAAEAAPAPAPELSSAQHKALTNLLAGADGVSRALAADSLDQLKPHAARLPELAAGLARELGADHAWQPLLKRLQAAVRWGTPATLEAAREAFLPFSTNLVELVQQVRAQEEDLRALKVYHCPMAPKPGLWFQAEGPLRNPYFGAEMLTCGTEVKPRALAPKSRPRAVVSAATPAAHPFQAGPATAAPPPAPAPASPGPHPRQPAHDSPHSEPPIAPAAAPLTPGQAALLTEPQPLNTRDHSAFDNRMNNALSARFARLRSAPTNFLRDPGAPSPRSTTTAAKSPTLVSP